MELGRLRRSVNGLGVLSAGCYALHTLLSYGMAAVLPWNGSGNERGMLLATLEALGLVTARTTRWVSGELLQALPHGLVLAYVVPYTIATFAFIVLLALLVRHGDAIDAALCRSLFRWSAIFGAASLLALPVIVEDFWMTPVWGRMAVAGVNPYYASAAPEFLVGLPLAKLQLHMTYGPLWALFGCVIAVLSGKSWVAALLVFKALLFGAWLGTVRVLWLLVQDEPAAYQARVLAVAGWLPIGVHMAVAEGHNDIVMVLGVALWLLALQRERRWSTAALFAASAVKYVSAPLLLLDALFWLRRGRAELPRYFAQGLAGSLVMVLAFAPFFRSLAFFDGTRAMHNWHFFRLADAAIFAGSFAHLPAHWLERLVHVALGAVCLLAILLYVRRGTRAALHFAALGILSLVTLHEVGHVWPWFLVWMLPFIALVLDTHLARLALGVSLAIPYALVPWTFGADGERWRWQLPALAVYACAAAVWAVTTLLAHAARARASGA